MLTKKFSYLMAWWRRSNAASATDAVLLYPAIDNGITHPSASEYLPMAVADHLRLWVASLEIRSGLSAYESRHAVAEQLHKILMHIGLSPLINLVGAMRYLPSSNAAFPHDSRRTTGPGEKSRHQRSTSIR